MQSYLPFEIKYSPIQKIALISFEKCPDAIYRELQLQYVNGEPYGTGYRVIAYRNDDYVDIYDDKALNFIRDEKFNVTGKGLNKHVQTEINNTLFSREDNKQTLAFEFTDVENRQIKVYIEEKYRPDLNWETEPEKRYTGYILSQFTREDAKELAETDPAGRQILERWKCNEMDHMSIVVIQESDQIKEIRTFFQKRDEQLGYDWKTRKALFCLVQGLQSIPQKILAENFLMFCNMLLQEAKVLDEMEDYDLAMFEKWLIGKSVKGNVFVAQSKTPYTAATFTKANIITESAKQNATLESMISYLLIHGNGCADVKTTSVETPFVAETDEPYDLVIMNRSAEKRKTKYSDWHDCYKNIKDKLSETGRFYGLVKNKNLFAMLDKQGIFKEAIDSKELDTIVLLPKKYGCSIVSINKAKKNPNYVSLVDLYNEDICFDFATNCV